MLDKIGTVGAMIAAGLAPCCFPLLGFIGTALGLTAFEQFAPQLDILIRVLVAVALFGSISSFRIHRSVIPLLISVSGTGLVFYHYYGSWNPTIVYLGFGLLLVGGVWSSLLIRSNRKQKNKEIIDTSTITCPECGFRKEEKMPMDACEYFWECPNCGVMLKPKEGDCCVYCSYGSVPCPPIQSESDCCTKSSR